MAEVKNAGRQHSVSSRLHRTREIVDDPRPTARNQGNVDVASDDLDEFGVESLGCPVRVHRIQQDLTRTALRRLFGSAIASTLCTATAAVIPRTGQVDVAIASPRVNAENNAPKPKRLPW